MVPKTPATSIHELFGILKVWKGPFWGFEGGFHLGLLGGEARSLPISKRVAKSHLELEPRNPFLKF